MADRFGGLESLDTSGTLARLRKEADAGSTESGLKYVDSAFSVFRGVMIGLFVLLFVAALMGIVSGGFLLVAADQEVDGHDEWKSRARAMGGVDIAFMFIFLAFSAYALYVMIRYEKAMSYMLHRVTTGGLAPVVKTAAQHLNMQNTVQLQQLPQGQSYPSVLPTTGQAAGGVPAPVAAPTSNVSAGFQFD